MKIMKNVFTAVFLLLLLVQISLFGQMRNPEDVNDWRGKTIMVFSPHPDDELYAAGTLAKLVKNGNKVYIIQFCTGNAGSRDLEMTCERLAMIRRDEDIRANKIIGIPKENIIWLGHDDGLLEYVTEKDLCEKLCRLIRKYRPDAVFSYDPGAVWMQWHKTDHRMASFVSLDASRAAAYHLVFPHHRIYEKLMPFTVTDFFFFGSREPDYKVDITDVAELKCRAACQHTSQFGKGNYKYKGPEMAPDDKEKLRRRWLQKDSEGRIYEHFRRVQESLSF